MSDDNNNREASWEELSAHYKKTFTTQRQTREGSMSTNNNREASWEELSAH